MSLKADFEDTFRLMTMRAPRHQAAFSGLAFVLLGALLILVMIAGQWLGAGENAHFQIYGVNASFTWVAVVFASIAIFAGRNANIQRNLALTLVIGSALSIPFAILGGRNDEASHTHLMWLAVAVGFWSLVVTWRAFQGGGARRPILLTICYTLCATLAVLAIPYWPAFPGETFKPSTANFWEVLRSASRAKDTESNNEDRARWRALERHLADVEAAQPQRVEAALAALAPRQRNKPNIFVIGVAGYADQDVFQRETDQSIEIMKTRFGADGHMLTLVNNPASIDTRPIASVQNLAAALRGVAARMDRDKDALVLSMTSHGSREGFSLENSELVGRTLSPQTLKAMLDAAGVKNRVIIVSACYSGVFKDAFEDESTVVITAASSSRTSFGCANENKWTYFGEAFFDKGLREEGALIPAFAKAAQTISERETKEKLTHSDPQMRVGAEFQRRFPTLVGALPSRDAKPEKQKSASAGSN